MEPSWRKGDSLGTVSLRASPRPAAATQKEREQRHVLPGMGTEQGQERQQISSEVFGLCILFFYDTVCSLRLRFPSRT